MGIYNMQARFAAEKITLDEFSSEVNSFWDIFNKTLVGDNVIQHISITRGAFPEENENNLNRYLTVCKKMEKKTARNLLEFAAFSVLEEISFYQKRWSIFTLGFKGKPFLWEYRI